MTHANRNILVLMGPTGTGKSALAIRVAQTTPTVIINADAMQMVRDLRIISARPSVQDEATAEHALYGVLDATEPTSVARWIALVKPVIEQAWASGKLPMLVGGTGMYVKALRDGLADIPPIPDEIRRTLRNLTAEQLHAMLSQADPIMAQQLKPGDTQRLTRALEVVQATGKSLHWWQDQPARPVFADTHYKLAHLTLPREMLYQRLNDRFAAMMRAGALDEVERLMARKLPADTPILRAHGVPELIAQLQGTMDAAAATEKAQQNTRNYAKRQMTWLRNQMPESQPIAADDPAEQAGFLHGIVTQRR